MACDAGTHSRRGRHSPREQRAVPEASVTALPAIQRPCSALASFAQLISSSETTRWTLAPVATQVANLATRCAQRRPLDVIAAPKQRVTDAHVRPRIPLRPSE